MSGNSPAPPQGRDKFDAWFDDANAERDRLTERVAELVTEGNDLRRLVAARSDRLENLAVEWGKRAKVARNRSTQTVARMAERYDECANMLEHCAAGLRRAAELDAPAVVTAGAEHLAEKIRDLAIPDEES